MPPVYDEDYLEEERKKYYDRTISYDDWVKNGYSAGPSDGKGSITLITDVPTYEAPSDDPKFKDSYWDQVNWATYTPKKTTNNNSGGNSGGNSATNDRYAGYRADLDALYNQVMGYGGYTAGSYTPGRYSAKYDTSGLEKRLNGFLDEIDNYEEFKYDLNADMLYKNAVDNALMQGQLAMQDTTAQAAALSGGYGNSYAATVGNQAYQNYLTQVNNNIPAFQQMALNTWQTGLDQLMNQYNAGTQQLNNYLALEAQNFAQWQANENLAFSAWKANEDNRYNEWLAGYNQILDQYNLGSTHIGNLETYQPTSYSSGSSSSKKEDTVYYRNAYDDYMKDTAAALAATQGSPYTYEQYYEALKQQNAANYRQSVEEDQKKKNKQ